MSQQAPAEVVIQDVDALIAELEAEYTQIRKLDPIDNRARASQALITTFLMGCCATL